jgi:hypothetical protein
MLFSKRVETRHCDSNSKACKPGRDHSDPSNSCPISLLSSMSKILERVFLKRLNAFIFGHNVPPNSQFDFRAAHSTSYQLKRVVRHVKNRRAQAESTGMLLLDMKRAFDSVCHDDLLHKLILIRDWNVFLVRIICSFLNDPKLVSVNPNRPSVIILMVQLL